jgi:hypothetical protein
MPRATQYQDVPNVTEVGDEHFRLSKKVPNHDFAIGMGLFTLKRAEATAAALLTIAAIWLRYVAATAGGALWRDEANTVELLRLHVADGWP